MIPVTEQYADKRFKNHILARKETVLKKLRRWPFYLMIILTIPYKLEFSNSACPLANITLIFRFSILKMVEWFIFSYSNHFNLLNTDSLINNTKIYVNDISGIY